MLLATFQMCEQVEVGDCGQLVIKNDVRRSQCEELSDLRLTCPHEEVTVFDVDVTLCICITLHYVSLASDHLENFRFLITIITDQTADL